jgi:hypothetical protein
MITKEINTQVSRPHSSASRSLHTKAQGAVDISESAGRQRKDCRAQSSIPSWSLRDERARTSHKDPSSDQCPCLLVSAASVCFTREPSSSPKNFDRPRPIAYGFDGVAGAADPLSGAAGFVKSASEKFTFKSILSITSFCVRSVAELPESISNANFNPPTSR